MVIGAVSNPAGISWILEKFVWALLYSSFGLALIWSFVSLGLVILFGPEQINVRPKLRRFVLVTGIVGLLFAVYIVIRCAPFLRDFTNYGYPATPKGFILFVLPRWKITLTFGGPLVVGFRYLPRLLRRK